MANLNYYQQLHAEDDGVIVLIANETGAWAFVCSKCKSKWEPQSIFPMKAAFGADFKPYRPEEHTL